MQGANDAGARAVEAEATRVAKRAAEALRQSRASVQVYRRLRSYHPVVSFLIEDVMTWPIRVRAYGPEALWLLP